jgi:hypothetical protein
MFSIAFMVLVFVLTQTVSHSFPKLCAALQKSLEPMLRVAPAPAVFST